LVFVWSWKGFVSLTARWNNSRAGGLALLVFLGGCAVGNSFGFAHSARYLNRCSHREELAEVCAWLRTHSPPDALVAATLTEPTMHFHHYSGRRVVENYLQPEPWFSVAAASTNGAPRASYVLLTWYSKLKPEQLRGGLQLEKSSSRGNYRLYRVTDQ
jgi:hypothetical protein